MKIIKLAMNYGYGCWISPEGEVKEIRGGGHAGSAERILFERKDEYFPDTKNIKQSDLRGYRATDWLVDLGWTKVGYNGLMIEYKGKLGLSAKKKVFEIINNDEDELGRVYVGNGSGFVNSTKLDARRFINENN